MVQIKKKQVETNSQHQTRKRANNQKKKTSLLKSIAKLQQGSPSKEKPIVQSNLEKKPVAPHSTSKAKPSIENSFLKNSSQKKDDSSLENKKKNNKTERKKQIQIPSLSKLKKKQVKKQGGPHVESEEKISFSLSDEDLQKLKQIIYKKDGIKSIQEWDELECYPLVDHFVHAVILQHKETKERRYFLVEILLSKEEQEHLAFIKDTFEVLSSDTINLIEYGEDAILRKEVNEIINDYSLSVNPDSKVKIIYYLKKDFLGLGRLEPIMRDPHIEDISCDGSDVPLFVYHRIHGSVQSNVLFPDEEDLSSFVMRLAQKCGKHISISHPMLDATMPDGSRIQMTLSTEVSTKGSTFTIRKFKEQPFSPADLINFNTMSSEMMAYLWLAVQYGNSALVSGGTASGKTSVLNAMSLFIPREAKIVSIEETREINLPHPNWIPGVARSGFGDIVGGKMTGEIDLFDLMKAALRQRPEYIIVGEIRGREAYVLFQAMATGHTTYSTVHADSTKSLIHRLEGEPINIPRIMLQSLDIVCIQSIARVKNKRVRRCKQIIEIIDIDPTTKEILTNEVFRWDPIKDTFFYTGKSFILEQIRVKTNMKRDEIQQELKKRSHVLSWMVREEMYTFEKVAGITANYLEKPDEVLDKISVKAHE